MNRRARALECVPTDPFTSKPSLPLTSTCLPSGYFHRAHLIDTSVFRNRSSVLRIEEASSHWSGGNMTLHLIWRARGWFNMREDSRVEMEPTDALDGEWLLSLLLTGPVRREGIGIGVATPSEALPVLISVSPSVRQSVSYSSKCVQSASLRSRVTQSCLRLLCRSRGQAAERTPAFC